MCVPSTSGWLAGDVRTVGRPFPTTPTFVLPYRRFATPCLINAAKIFLHGPKTTYQDAVLHNRCQIGYPIRDIPQSDHSQQSRPEPSESEPTGHYEAAPNERTTEDAKLSLHGAAPDQTEEPSVSQPVVSPSTVWRFVGWLGSLSWMLDKAREMILKQNPNSLCHRIDGRVAPEKHRGDQRQATLETARQLLLIIPEWEELFGCTFFPRFATRSGFD